MIDEDGEIDGYGGEVVMLGECVVGLMVLVVYGLMVGKILVFVYIKLEVVEFGIDLMVIVYGVLCVVKVLGELVYDLVSKLLWMDVV